MCGWQAGRGATSAGKLDILTSWTQPAYHRVITKLWIAELEPWDNLECQECQESHFAKMLDGILFRSSTTEAEQEVRDPTSSPAMARRGIILQLSNNPSPSSACRLKNGHELTLWETTSCTCPALEAHWCSQGRYMVMLDYTTRTAQARRWSFRQWPRYRRYGQQ